MTLHRRNFVWRWLLTFCCIPVCKKSGRDAAHVTAGVFQESQIFVVAKTFLRGDAVVAQKPTGRRNSANFCYMHAVTQMLLRQPEVRQEVLDSSARTDLLPVRDPLLVAVRNQLKELASGFQFEEAEVRRSSIGRASSDEQIARKRSLCENAWVAARRTLHNFVGQRDSASVFNFVVSHGAMQCECEERVLFAANLYFNIRTEFCSSTLLLCRPGRTSIL